MRMDERRRHFDPFLWGGNDIVESGGVSAVEIRRMLPKGAQRSGTTGLVCRARGIEEASCPASDTVYNTLMYCPCSQCSRATSHWLVSPKEIDAIANRHRRVALRSPENGEKESSSGHKQFHVH